MYKFLFLVLLLLPLNFISNAYSQGVTAKLPEKFGEPPSICGWPVRDFTLPTGRYHIIFGTKTFYSGNLGGRTGADAKCQEEAERNPDLENLKPGATWRAFIATTSPYRSVKNSVQIRGNIYRLPPLKTDANAGSPPTSLDRVLDSQGEPNPITSTPNFWDCTTMAINICSNRTANGATYTHGSLHYWTGAMRSSAPSSNSLPNGLDCGNWTNAASWATGAAGEALNYGSLPDAYNDGSAANHSCNYTLPLLCINEEP